MTIGVPSQLAPALFAQAFSRLLLVYSAVSIILAEILIIFLAIHENQLSLLWVGLLTGIPGVILSWMMFNPFSPVLAWIHITILTATFIFDVWFVLGVIPSIDMSWFLPFTLLGFALICTAGVGRRRRERLLWASVGLVATFLAMAIGSVLAGATFAINWLILLGYVLLVVAIYTVPHLLKESTLSQQKFDQVAFDVLAEKQKTSFVKAQAATVHDTLLASLSLLSVTKPGPLKQEVRDEIELTLARLNQGAVFPAPRAPLQSEVDSALLPLMEVINHAESLGLKIHLNGDIRALEGSDCDAFEALTAAVAQCLKNVVQHSGQFDVELVVLRSQENISFTIIDGGKGFLLEDVPQDRLGLKVSVFERMQNVGGSATVWSKPGNGAAIMLQIPTKGAA